MKQRGRAPGPARARHELASYPYGGRNYEYQSEDPYLSGVMSVETIKGIQSQGIHANAKHFAGNEQETQRRQMATLIPPRALHELYLLPFEMSVKDAQPASVMCAFPEINGVSACSNEDLLKTTLRDNWGFKGYVITDRRALHDTAPRSKPGWTGSFPTSHRCSIRWSRSADNVGIRWGRFRVDLATAASPKPTSTRCSGAVISRCSSSGTSTSTSMCSMRRSPIFSPTAFWLAKSPSKAIVLLKNQNNFLPLNAANIKSVALIGAKWYAGMAKLPPRSISGDNVSVSLPTRSLRSRDWRTHCGRWVPQPPSRTTAEPEPI